MADQLNEEQIAELKGAFSLFDRDNDGTISSTELGAAMRSVGRNLSEAELKIMIEEADVNENGIVDFQDFLVLMTRKPKSTLRSEMEEAFKVFDKDGSETISSDELKQVMSTLGEKLSDEEVHQMINEVDLNKDGEVDYNEFLDLMKVT